MREGMGKGKGNDGIWKEKRDQEKGNRLSKKKKRE